jgi:hypothetical protein
MLRPFRNIPYIHNPRDARQYTHQTHPDLIEFQKYRFLLGSLVREHFPILAQEQGK